MVGQLRDGRQPPFQAVFGKRPNVRLVEALLRLRGEDFTRSEWAIEAGLTRASTNRQKNILALGIVNSVGGTATKPILRVNDEDPLVGALLRSYVAIDSALAHPVTESLSLAESKVLEVPEIGEVRFSSVQNAKEFLSYMGKDGNVKRGVSA